jgi:hypothetical protein
MCFQLWKSLKLPVDNPSKPVSQIIMHAIEELYFLRRYEEAENITTEVLKGQLQDDFRKTIESYLQRCIAKQASAKTQDRAL